GHSREQAYDDLVQYSPVLAQLSVSYDDEARAVSASLLGLDTKSASYRPGLGCAVDYPGSNGRGRIEPILIPASLAPWPAGRSVTTRRAGMQSLLEDIVARDNALGLNTRALLVVHGGEIIGEAYAQEADARTPLLGWSMAKSLIAVMLGNLELRGLLDPEAAAPFPAWAGDERAAIRIVDMLTMTDGLDFSEEYNPGDDATAMLFTSPSMSDYALARPLANPPGTVFSYSSGTANLLARLHQEIHGGPQAAYEDFMNFIYEPLGFQHAVFETDASGVFAGSSYFYASARDWARLGQLMLDGGEINGTRVVSTDWVQRATAPNPSQNDRAYGYQWWLNAGNARLRLPALPEESFYANGNRQQFVIVVPSADAVIVRLGWTAGS
ncbi:MAG: serine hydrolase, partial [Pseudohongiellaceae bacterium]